MSENNIFARGAEHTLTGNILYHYNFHSQILGNSRTIIVYLPPSYNKEVTKSYPVLYMQDGQNIFDAATSFNGEWGVDECVEKLIKEKKIEEIIVVGIYNNDNRINEYTPTYDQEQEMGGEADAYLNFLIDELKPVIDNSYRTKRERENTAIMGSSLGALLSLYAGIKYNSTFSKIGALSPSLWWDKHVIFKIYENDYGSFVNRVKIFIDMGAMEGEINSENLSQSIIDSRKFRDLIIDSGANSDNLRYYEDPDGYHNEVSWRERVRMHLEFFFPNVPFNN